jgi:hypothetical protein
MSSSNLPTLTPSEELDISGGGTYFPAVVVSTAPNRGDWFTGDFESPAEAVQHAYDQMVGQKNLPQTLVLDPSGGPFEMDAPLEIWQSQTRVTSSSGVCLVPAEGYCGPLLTTGLRDETRPGEDGLLTNITIDNLHLDGRMRSKGIVLRHVQLSTFRGLHIRNTDGAALRLSDFCIENLFDQLVLSDQTGSATEPTLWIEPENTGIFPMGGQKRDLGNITVNSTFFNGIMIHFPNNDALRISSGGASVELCRRHRKIQFNGCFFHGHDRLNKPLITLEDCFELSFVGCQMLLWNTSGTIMRLGEHESQFPTGSVMVSHCTFVGKPGESLQTMAFELRNVETGCGCLSVFGNNIGSNTGLLGYAADFGNKPETRISWTGNLVQTQNPPFKGVQPENADISPFTPKQSERDVAISDKKA